VIGKTFPEKCKVFTSRNRILRLLEEDSRRALRAKECDAVAESPFDPRTTDIDRLPATIAVMRRDLCVQTKPTTESRLFSLYGKPIHFRLEGRAYPKGFPIAPNLY
jgi:hypothetical protein